MAISSAMGSYGNAQPRPGILFIYDRMVKGVAQVAGAINGVEMWVVSYETFRHDIFSMMDAIIAVAGGPQAIIKADICGGGDQYLLKEHAQRAIDIDEAYRKRVESDCKREEAEYLQTA